MRVFLYCRVAHQDTFALEHRHFMEILFTNIRIEILLLVKVLEFSLSLIHIFLCPGASAERAGRSRGKMPSAETRTKLN